MPLGKIKLISQVNEKTPVAEALLRRDEISRQISNMSCELAYFGIEKIYIKLLYQRNLNLKQGACRFSCLQIFSCQRQTVGLYLEKKIV